MQEVVIVDGLRTPIGAFLGGLANFSAPDLASFVIEALVKKNDIDPQSIDQLILGQVLQAGVGQAPARQALLKAGLSVSSACVTVNKVCGSGLKAVMMAHDAIALDHSKIVIAGGMESMSNAPHALLQARTGLRMGDKALTDLITNDGLLDPASKAHMGEFSEACAQTYKFSRQAQDEYAVLSYEKAIHAQKQGFFNNELVSINTVEQDEEPLRYRPEKMPNLKPAFLPTGSITAANASKINDGAAALLLMSKSNAQDHGMAHMASIVGMANFAHEPALFSTAPAFAIKQALQKANLSLSDIDCFEINEAFSVVSMACIKDLNLDPKKVNMFGGAVALGHPIGASGARILVTLLNVMQVNNFKYGVAAICLGGGEALAMVVKM
jgi:acetyl-CoA C-acetyltransferase